ncbi:hypothetical protein [Pseudomonas sp. JR33AA]|uniref:hypothetical protein n=1 Tax=Pseudomonas sp. JR33AA TaxID=2899113 RepID=UPI001F2B32C1|nr:hypothetical protein [Pseudomonas sp. JR33AA]MCE5979902.1 hypothetical protein [Pseudomonas sp. JR33AA]
MNERLEQDEALEAPTIEGLTALNEIDLDALGDKPLTTLVKYTGMNINDHVVVRWLGRSAAGKAYDYTAEYFLGGEHLDGLEVQITNSYIKDAAGGEAFYSYSRQANGPEPEAASLRTFCYIGVRPRRQVETLSVLQVVDSHGLIIQPDKLPTSGMRVVVPPYQAMQADDKVTLTVECYEPDGTLDDTWEQVVTVTQDHFGESAISGAVPKRYFDWIDPGYVLATYEIEFAAGGRLDAPVQRLQVDSKGTLPGYLGKPTIDEYDEGDPLDPRSFPNGLLVKLPDYPGIADSDYLTLQWSIPGGQPYMPSVRVDPSIRAADSIPFWISPETLAISQGSNVSVSYLYGREGEALRSEVLQVNVQHTRLLNVPLVEGAVTDGNASNGNILADLSIEGVYVNVPPGISLPGEELHVHWAGTGPLGEYVAKAPASQEKPLRFFIPPEYVSTNMGRTPADTSWRFDVFYRLSTDADTYIDSMPYKLRIKPLDIATLPTVDLTDGPVELGKLPEAGARLSMAKWPFIAPGQLLTIVMEGVDPRGNGVEFIVRDAKAITDAEVRNGVNNEMLPKSELRKLKIGERFTLYARVSFNGGEFYLKYPSQSTPLNP